MKDEKAGREEGKEKMREKDFCSVSFDFFDVLSLKEDTFGNMMKNLFFFIYNAKILLQCNELPI